MRAAAQGFNVIFSDAASIEGFSGKMAVTAIQHDGGE
jgi:hypothetical protein